MGLFRRKPGTDVVHIAEPVREPDPIPEPPEDTDFIWRCTTCGAMGINRVSLHAHIGKVRRGKACEAEGIKHYVLAKEQEYETKEAEVSASDTWVVVKMAENVGEGEVERFVMGREDPWPTTVIEASTGLGAIQVWYKQKVDKLGRDATEEDREACNGRYVALNFFTGHRAEALVESQWRANVEVAEGSHV